MESDRFRGLPPVTRPPDYPRTPQLDKEDAARDAGSQEIGTFLEWLWHEQYVEFFRREPTQVQCTHCGGRGHTKEYRHNPREIQEWDEEISELLAKVTPTQLGFACGYCHGKGYVEREEEFSGPDNALYWLRRYFKIDAEIVEYERREVLRWVQSKNTSDMLPTSAE